uniref:COR domain-containing protein n=1 Tax=Amphimedon queenslandica TaxID=400682 RepID=A0A1X7TM84_AMPQE
MDVAYSRVLFLGTAGVGKTSFKHSLMKLPWVPNTTSTVVSDISQVRPFTHEWHTLKDQWRVVSYEDEIKELAGLILTVYKKELDSFDVTAYDHNKSSLSVPETHSNIIFEVDKIVSDALSYIKKNPTLPLKPQPFLHFWDCGGQPPFLEILPVFLTSRTLFFLVFDAEKDLKSNWKSVINIEGERVDQEEVHMTTLDYMLNWMANIHGHLMTYNEKGGFCEFPRMYCVGTHGDCIKDHKSEIKRELEQHYQSKDFCALIEGTVIVDNTTSGQGEAEDPSLQTLRDAVIRFTEEKLVLKTPLSWVLFRKVIQVLSKKFNVISLKDASIVGAASKIPVKDMHNVLMFYHELGVLLFYPQIEGMKDMVIINPGYIVDALGEIFPLSVNFHRGRHRKEWKLFHDCGIFVQPLYVELWEKYKDISSEFFIKVLVHFRIAVEVGTDKYPPPSKQYFMPLVLKSTQVDRSSMKLPSNSIQAAPLHITFKSGFVPPGFFTRFVVTLANARRMELCFEKDVYRNCVTFRYQDPNSNSIEHVIVTDCHNVIQINIQHHHLDRELVSFTKICQDICSYLEDAAKEVEELLIKCASGGTANNKSTRYIFKYEFKYVCTSCPTTAPPHYITLPPTNPAQDSQWITLGISLGLYYNTLGVIEEKCRGDVQQCLLKCMAAWLRGEDKVRLKGGPSWLSLAEALEEIEENDIAKNIRANSVLVLVLGTRTRKK